jgi:hypothetical protein
VADRSSGRPHGQQRFIDQLLGSSIHFETAGSLHGGRRVWVLATLPDHVEVGGDDVRPYVLLMNSHDGSAAVVAATTPVRVVCQNTLNWGLRSAQQKFSIRHTEAVTQRVHEARRVLDLSIDYYAQFKRFGDQLASERCTERQLRAILGYLYAIGFEGRELVSYHWHPSGHSPITWPHMHISANVQVGDRWLGKVHLPTGPVGLERVVALAITELGAKPLRDNWELVIREAAARCRPIRRRARDLASPASARLRSVR